MPCWPFISTDQLLTAVRSDCKAKATDLDAEIGMNAIQSRGGGKATGVSINAGGLADHGIPGQSDILLPLPKQPG